MAVVLAPMISICLQGIKGYSQWTYMEVDRIALRRDITPEEGA